MKKVHWLPENNSEVSCYLIARDASKAIDFYKKVFDAKEDFRIPAPGDKVGHAEITIGQSRFSIADEFPEMGALSPEHFKGSPITMVLYVPDVDQTVKTALAHGATLDRPVKDQFYGDRAGSIKDPFGFTWHISTHVEDLSLEEVEKRARAAHS